MAEQATAMVAAGGAVWCGDETTVREFPPLRAAWAKRGQQRVGVISGRKGRRVLPGALNAATGDGVSRVRERRRQDACRACVAALGPLHPDVPKLLVWDNAPPHHPRRGAAAAAGAHIQMAWLPFRSPALMPCDDLWRRAKAEVAAHRPYREDQAAEELIHTLAEQAVRSIAVLSPFDRLRCSGLLGSKFQWLST